MPKFQQSSVEATRTKTDNHDSLFNSMVTQANTRKEKQAAMMNMIRADMTTNKDQFDDGSEITVDRYGNITGNSSYFQGFDKQFQDLSENKEGGKVDIKRWFDNADFAKKSVDDATAQLYEDNAIGRKTRDALLNDMLTNIPISGAPANLKSSLSGLQKSKLEKEAKDAIEKAKKNPTDANLVKEANDAIDKYNNAVQPSVNTKQHATSGNKGNFSLGVVSKTTLPSWEADQSETSLLDKGVVAEDITKRSTENLTRLANLQNALVGFNPAAVASNTYTKLIEERNKFAIELAKLEQSRYASKEQFGKMKVGAGTVDINLTQKVGTDQTFNVYGGQGGSAITAESGTIEKTILGKNSKPQAKVQIDKTGKTVAPSGDFDKESNVAKALEGKGYLEPGSAVNTVRIKGGIPLPPSVVNTLSMMQ